MSLNMIWLQVERFNKMEDNFFIVLIMFLHFRLLIFHKYMYTYEMHLHTFSCGSIFNDTPVLHTYSKHVGVACVEKLLPGSTTWQIYLRDP